MSSGLLWRQEHECSGGSVQAWGGCEVKFRCSCEVTTKHRLPTWAQRPGLWPCTQNVVCVCELWEFSSDSCWRQLYSTGRPHFHRYHYGLFFPKLLEFTDTFFFFFFFFTNCRFVAPLCQVNLLRPSSQRHMLTSHLCHSLVNSCIISNLFHYLICDQRSYYCKKVTTC